MQQRRRKQAVDRAQTGPARLKTLAASLVGKNEEELVAAMRDTGYSYRYLMLDGEPTKAHGTARPRRCIDLHEENGVITKAEA